MLPVALAPNAPRHIARRAWQVSVAPTGALSLRGKQVPVQCSTQRHHGAGGETGGVAVPEGYVLRRGTDADLPSIQSLVLAEKMNPLGLIPTRFTVACVAASTASGSGAQSTGAGVAALAGFVQTVPLGPTEGELTPTPSGHSAAGPVKLQSLVVLQEHRRKGLGSALVRQQLAALPRGTYVWLTAVERGVPFYQRLGFRLQHLPHVPRELWFEVAAGTVVARLAVNQRLVVMSLVIPAQDTAAVLDSEPNPNP